MRMQGMWGVAKGIGTNYEGPSEGLRLYLEYH